MNGRGARGPPQAQRLDEQPRQRARRLRGAEVVPHLRPVDVERPARRDGAVPVLGDGGRHDGHRGVGEGGRAAATSRDATSTPSREPTARTVSRTPGGASPGGRRPPLDDVVDEVVGRQRVPQCAGAQRHRPDGPDPFPGAQHGVRVDGLVRAVEDARPEVDDGRPQARPVVARPRHGVVRPPGSSQHRQARGACRFARLVGEDELAVAEPLARRGPAGRGGEQQVRDLVGDVVDAVAAREDPARRRRPCPRPSAGRSRGWRRSSAPARPPSRRPSRARW